MKNVKKLLIIYPIRVPREESSAEKKMEAIMAEISPNFVKDKLIDSRNSKQIQIKKKIQSHTYYNSTAENQIQAKILKAAGENHCIYE